MHLCSYHAVLFARFLCCFCMVSIKVRNLVRNFVAICSSNSIFFYLLKCSYSAYRVFLYRQFDFLVQPSSCLSYFSIWAWDCVTSILLHTKLEVFSISTNLELAKKDQSNILIAKRLSQVSENHFIVSSIFLLHI